MIGVVVVVVVAVVVDVVVGVVVVVEVVVGVVVGAIVEVVVGVVVEDGQRFSPGSTIPHMMGHIFKISTSPNSQRSFAMNRQRNSSLRQNVNENYDNF